MYTFAATTILLESSVNLCCNFSHTTLISTDNFKSSVGQFIFNIFVFDNKNIFICHRAAGLCSAENSAHMTPVVQFSAAQGPGHHQVHVTELEPAGAPLHPRYSDEAEAILITSFSKFRKYKSENNVIQSNCKVILTELFK